MADNILNKFTEQPVYKVPLDMSGAISYKIDSAEIAKSASADMLSETDDLKYLKDIPSTFVNPENVPMNDLYADNLVWVEMTAMPIHKFSNNVRAQRAYSTKGESIDENTGYESSLAIILDKARWFRFKFLCQQELMETISHDWQPYESVASMVQGLYARLFHSYPEQLRGFVGETGWNTKLNEATKKIGDAVVGAWNEPLKALNNVGVWGRTASKRGYVANYRADVPLQYKGSERRSFELIFNLINTVNGKNHENVVLPVKLLEMLSSPSYNIQPDALANADIVLPYAFTLRTRPGSLLTVDMAVLKQVQPTWRGPWIDGYPSRCEVRLSFQEYRPLEQKVFYGDTESKIQVIQTDRAKANEKNVKVSDYQTLNAQATPAAGKKAAVKKAAVKAAVKPAVKPEVIQI